MLPSEYMFNLISHHGSFAFSWFEICRDTDYNSDNKNMINPFTSNDD